MMIAAIRSDMKKKNNESTGRPPQPPPLVPPEWARAEAMDKTDALSADGDFEAMAKDSILLPRIRSKSWMELVFNCLGPVDIARAFRRGDFPRDRQQTLASE